MITRDEMDQQVINVLKKSKHYMPPVKLKNPKLILDLGCWIGYTTMRYAKLYKSAKIIACDADYDNALLASENCSGYSNVIVQHYCVGNPGTRQLSDISKNKRTLFGDGSISINVEADTIDHFLELLGLGNKTINFCKMDIEGAEKESLTGEWLTKTESLLIDLHGESLIKPLKSLGFYVKEYRPTIGCPGGRIWAWK